MRSNARAAAPNYDADVVARFGKEWSRFDQLGLDDVELRQMFDAYFHVFPWHLLPVAAQGFDLGCGSGRWARLVCRRVGLLHCIDASASALDVARRTLSGESNVRFHLASVDDIPLPQASADFGYCLGVLHHVPDPEAGLRAAVEKLKEGAPFLLYLYYSLDNRPRLYRAAWRASVLPRLVISRLPELLRHVVADVIAGTIYWPLARIARLLEFLGRSPDGIPLAAYRDRSFYTMRTDALDRFGTRIEKRFSRPEIQAMMQRCGLTNIVFSEQSPFWCAVGLKR